MKRAASWIAALAALVGAASLARAAPPVGQVTIELAGGPVNRIVPDLAFGAALDGMGRGEVRSLFTPFNIARMRSAGLKSVTYRTRAELGIEAWHWSDEGSWSDPSRKQGYWASSANPKAPTGVTWGYALPRRGDTIDQANESGYSRLDDGDAATFWKSNPYLDRRYTGVAMRPQWIVADLGAPTRIDAARIEWGTPFARRYKIQFWTGRGESDHRGRWTTFPRGALRGLKPDDHVLRLARGNISTRFVRVLLIASSGLAPAGSSDPRDGLGFAVREIHVGDIDAAGRFHDRLRHGPDKRRQSIIDVSSTDPWHRAIDRDVYLEQPGFDLVFRSGVTSGTPMMVPVGVLYDTPQNAVAELRYLRARGYPVRQVELGEEPDGQGVSPEDYADLYLETARALRGVDPTVELGGPSLQGAFTDTWPDPGAGWSWTRRFIARLRARRALSELNFFSFEHYPFDDICGRLGPKLLAETAIMARLDARLRADGVPKATPRIISEYGFSAFSGRAMSQLPSALLDADIVGQFLTLGGKAAYMFGYGPDAPINQHAACAGFGNMMLFQADARGQADQPMPAFYFARLLTGAWAHGGDAPNAIYKAASNIRDARGRMLVTAYALKRPDGDWSVMLVNRDPTRPHRLRLVLRGRGEPSRLGGRGGLTVATYGPDRYRWEDAGPASHPTLDLPPRRFTLPAGAPVTLPPWSLTVARESGPPG